MRLFSSITLIFFIFLQQEAWAIDANKLVEQAIEYWRDNTSYTEATMTVHRPRWQREMKFRAWTKDRDKSLVLFTAPTKDAGSASLTVKNEMWSFTPQINKIIKIPTSMRTQSWMGSDFSYRDLSKSDEIIDSYTHKLLGEETHNGKKVFIIESTPKEFAAVVWGKEVLHIREDLIILEHLFYDQDFKLVKRLTASDIGEHGGKIFAKTIRVENVEEPSNWTEVNHELVKFNIDIRDSMFTLSNLRNPRAN